jgi:type IV pilus secretin PilQ/predicted competence protein
VTFPVRLRALAALITALGIAAGTSAQAQSPPASGTATLPTTATTPAPERGITIDADNSSISEVLKVLADRGRLNIVTGPGVTEGRISIHIKDVPVDQAVNLVVRAAGLAYERIGNSILVADSRYLKEETGLSSYTVDLKYADAVSVKEALKDLCDKVQVDQGGNRLIVVTSPRVISQIRDVVRTIDVPTQQVMLEARIVEVGTDAAKKLGIDWALINRQTVTVVEGHLDSTVSRPGQLPTSIGFIPLANKFLPFNRQAYTMTAALDLMISDGTARVLATPRIATLNGKEANMLIGRRIPYEVSQTVFAGNAAAPTTTVEKEEVGVKLRITPLINADGYITTVISPEVSTVVGFNGQFQDLPIVATREATTTVRLKDGDTVIIGGLLEDDETRTVTKVPLLGDIPLIGVLFQHIDTEHQKNDLVIQVTPRIMQPGDTGASPTMGKQ